MATISLCLIAKNEGHRLDNCLSTFGQVVDEIILVDTGSTDNTKEVAKKYGAKIFDQEWHNDFSEARNLSFSKATCDYIMWADCDDILKDEDIKKLNELKPKMDKDYYSMWYNYRHDENGKCTYAFVRDRIVKRINGYYWDCAIHEALNVWGSHENCNIIITHTSNHDNGQKYIKFFEERMEKGFKLLPREKYYYGGECFVFGQYDKCINILESFVEDNYNGIYENKRTRDYLGKCYKIKKNYYKSLENYLQYMKYDKPTHNVIFEIADCCYNLNRIEESIFYYKIVVDNNFPIDNTTKIDPTSTIIKSCLQLCVLLFKQGNISESIKYNEIAYKLDSNNKLVLYNKKYFESLENNN